MNYRLPLVATLILGVQMVMGGIVVGKDAGFICPDWPLCHGMVLPKLTGMVILELVHRLTALLVSVLVVWIAILAWWKHREHRVLVLLATSALVSLLVQIIVGGLIVLFKFPGVVTTVDVVNSMVLLSLYIGITTESYRTNPVNHSGVQWPDKRYEQMAGTTWGILATGGVAVVVGALFRHTGASEALFGINDYLASHGESTMPSVPASTGLLVVHIMTAMFVAFSAMWFLLRALHTQLFRKTAWTLMVLVALQATLGILSLTSRLDFVLTTLHWSNAIAIIGVMSFAVCIAQCAKRHNHSTSVQRHAAHVSKPKAVN